MNSTIYHRRTYELLGAKPPADPSASAILAHCESRLNTPLPDSLREWYSLEGAVARINSRSDTPTPLEDFEITDSEYLVILTENQGVALWAVLLDGSEDPPVFVQVDPPSPSPWLPCAPTFSIFVHTQVWDGQSLRKPCLMAQEVGLRQEDRRFLQDNFEEFPRTTGYPGHTQHRFGSDDKRILLWEDERQTDWFITASSDSSLRELARRLLHCGDLRNTLYGSSELEVKLLDELRKTPDPQGPNR